MIRSRTARLLFHVADCDRRGRPCRKQRRALGARVALAEPPEAVEQDVMGERYLVDREVALEHTAVRAELLDAVAHDGSDGGSQLLRADRRDDRASQEGAPPKPRAVRGTHVARLGTLAFRVGRRVRISFAPAGSLLRTEFSPGQSIE